MNGPVEFARMQKRVDELLAAAPSWGDLVKEFAPAQVHDEFRPEDRAAILLAGMWRADPTALWWIFRLTLDAPYPHIGQTRDAAALAAKAHEARVAVGRAILAAIKEGEQLLDRKEPQT